MMSEFTTEERMRMLTVCRGGLNNALCELRDLRQDNDVNLARYCAIAITELEKIIAFVSYYIASKIEDDDGIPY